MPVYQLSVFFESGDAEGWSERYFVNEANITNAQADLDALITQAARLRTSGIRIVYGRVSDVTIRGDSLPSTLSMPVVGDYTAPLGSVILEANVGILVQLFGNSQRKNRITLRGLTTAKIVGREIVAEPTWDARFTTYSNLLTAGLYRIRHRTAVGPPPVYDYTTVVSQVIPLYATARKPGRPFGTLRGRR